MLTSAETTQATRQAAVDILEKKCGVCHGAAEMSGLDMRQREKLLKGGKRGPAIRPGKAGESLLYQASSHQSELKMPPGSANPLPSEELKILEKWINEGALWPERELATAKAEPSWWSFKKVHRPAVPRPRNQDRIGNPIDAFILAKLEEKGLKPAPRADKHALVRRLYFDLTGLPPTPEQVDRFLKNSSAEAYENLIEELLASPRYGERWGRLWLDVVRYADSAGFEGDVYYPNAWRYRDYVIKSFNEDKPYDRFVQEQIAGDELWPDDLELQGFYDVPPAKLEHLEARVGTALYSLGPQIQESFLDGAKLRNDWLTDAVDTTGSAFLGLTFGCARCHDHKFDPIPQRDYYRLQAVFAASWPVQIPVVTGLSMTHRDESYHWMIALDEARTAYQKLEKTVKDRVIEAKKKDFPPEVVRAYEIPAERRTAQEAEIAAPLLKAYNDIKIEEFLTEKERGLHKELLQRLASTVLNVPAADASHRVRFDGFFDVPTATVLGHVEPEIIPDTYILERGDLGKNKGKVGPGLPGALSDETGPQEMPREVVGPRYRKQLALWLTRPDHPLTARVVVNRIWQGHFGRGIVSTANDFGGQGQLPTHPELLDWLASEFVSRGWSIKTMHRLILLSNTYRMSSLFTDPDNARKDPQNLYFWRMNRRRLEAEAVWDAIHASAGTLDLKMGGRPVMPPLSKSEMAALRIKPWWVPPADPSEADRRAVYILSRRNFTFPMFDKFDRPESSTSCPRREETTVAPQILWTLNNQSTYAEAQQFAARLVKERGDKPTAWVDAAWRIALAREPSPIEVTEA
ncbi:MAG: PSD1 domain-containing protein, partial [Acidobacteria bacterium]|nr:PSD1 domain-containing protein [Acidobacteriota bacterium]